jgi:hypothetical protein
MGPWSRVGHLDFHGARELHGPMGFPWGHEVPMDPWDSQGPMGFPGAHRIPMAHVNPMGPWDPDGFLGSTMDP